MPNGASGKATLFRVLQYLIEQVECSTKAYNGYNRLRNRDIGSAFSFRSYDFVYLGISANTKNNIRSETITANIDQSLLDVIIHDPVLVVFERKFMRNIYCLQLTAAGRTIDNSTISCRVNKC